MVNKEYGDFKEKVGYEDDTHLRMNKMISFIKNEIDPPLGADYDIDVLKKYGRTVSNYCSDGWEWNDKLYEDTEKDLWEIIAVCEWYWRKKYEKWYEDDEKVLSNFDRTVVHNYRIALDKISGRK